MWVGCIRVVRYKCLPIKSTFFRAAGEYFTKGDQTFRNSSPFYFRPACNLSCWRPLKSSLQQRTTLGTAPAVQKAFSSNQKKLHNTFVVCCKQGDAIPWREDEERSAWVFLCFYIKMTTNFTCNKCTEAENEFTLPSAVDLLLE